MTLEELETLRKKARNTGLIGITISAIIVIIFFILSRNIFLSFGVLIIGIVITSFIAIGPRRKFVLAFKQTFVLTSLKSVFTDLVYEPEKGLEKSIIGNTGMMHMGDVYSSNDFISGKYKNINVVQADVHIEEEHERTDGNGNTTTTYETIFRGKWMIFDFNKTFKANVQVSQKGFTNSKISNYRNVKYKKVMMEDQAFNNSFTIYAQDEHEAFYILTPALMDKIKTLTNTISGRLLFCFIDNKLHIGLYNNKDSFEPSIYKKIEEEKILEDITKDIKEITNFVDELNLDNDLFRREV